jgi:RNA polymerase sigma-70 factor (ECF subfamily)
LQQRQDPLAVFEAHRRRLFGLAYRMLGSRVDAEDVVQETYLRWHAVDHTGVGNAEAWLVTAATRLALDRLRRAASERASYAGSWLPEPVVEPAPPPDRKLELAADLSIAFLTLLERLAPEERAAFLLHDVFDVGYPQIASAIGRSEAACRQVVHRARERVQGERRRFEAEESSKAELLRRFMAAAEARDERQLLALFAPDATWTVDNGGKTGAPPPVFVGAARIARLVLALHEKFRGAARTTALASVNGETGLCVRDGDRLVSTLSIATDGARILAVYVVVNPDKLR